MSLLGNPLVLRLGLIFLGIALGFAVTVVFMRRMRRSLSAEISFSPEAAAAEGSPLYAVIQQLKQQKYELQTERQAERRRAKTSENISAAILSHLSSGVMFLTPDGLVRQANAAARQILGFASPVGVTAAQIFRASTEILASGEAGARISDIVQHGLRQKTPFQQFETVYVTPAGEERTLEITLTAVHSPAGEVLGSACLVDDQTEVVKIRREEFLRGEVSSEMGLELHKSVRAISGYAQRLQLGSDLESARQLGGDIAAEAAHLEHSIGGFLSGASKGRAVSVS